MRRSPLEIYKEAYDLQHSEKKNEKALEIYRSIIADFPESDAAGYASVQIAELTADLPKRQYGILWVAVVLMLIFIVLVVGGFSFFMEKYKTNEQKLAYMSELAKIRLDIDNGLLNDALNRLLELKTEYGDDLQLYSLTADIFLKKKDFEGAKIEFDTYLASHPNSREAKAGLRKVKLLKEKDAKKMMEKKKRAKPKKIVRYKREVVPKPRIVDSNISYF